MSIRMKVWIVKAVAKLLGFNSIAYNQTFRLSYNHYGWQIIEDNNPVPAPDVRHFHDCKIVGCQQKCYPC